MKAGLHPQYVESHVTCACGNTFTTRSTKPEMRTDLCAVCHPFYTGEQRIVDTAGQVERFTKRMEAASSAGPSVSKRQQRLNIRAEELAERERQEREERERQEAAERGRAAERQRARAAAEAEAAAEAGAVSTDESSAQTEPPAAAEPAAASEPAPAGGEPASAEKDTES